MSLIPQRGNCLHVFFTATILPWVYAQSLNSSCIPPSCISPTEPPPPEASAQLNTFNASVVITPDNTSSLEVQVAADFERSNWAGYSVHDDPFYQLPAGPLPQTAGQIIRVQESVNVSLFTLPPQLALSRILYTTQNLNGTVIPASAFVLWPFSARNFTNINGVPLVGWGHGTTGIAGECAPSHLRNLWYQYHAPFPLAIQGYAVVAPDYAGLGIDRDGQGNTIPHQWSANPAGANDLLFAIQAAQQAWGALSREFVTLGHSEGGSIVWSLAQKLAHQNVSGYLGGVAASPLNTIMAYTQSPVSTPGVPFVISVVAKTLISIFPDSFQLEDWLTPTGIETLNTYVGLQGCQAVAEELFYTPGIDYAYPNWTEGWYLTTYNDLVTNGDMRPFAGPLLVLQGTADTQVPPSTNTDIVNRTCSLQPDSQLHYVMFQGVDHVPTMYAGQQYWLDWIADRFNRVPVPQGCLTETQSSLRPIEEYEPKLNYFMEYPLYGYETA